MCQSCFTPWLRVGDVESLTIEVLKATLAFVSERFIALLL